MKPTWQSDDGRIQLYHADCLDVLPHLSGIDAVVTDPPYGVGFKYDGHDDTREGYDAWCCCWFDELQKLTQTCLMSVGAVNVAMWGRIRPFRWQVAWLKPAAMGRSPVGFCNWEPMPLWGSGSGQSVDVFTAGILPDDRMDGHPCPKPVKWGVESVLRAAKEGQTVLDCFMGSGTVGIGCVQTGRRFVGIEKVPDYFEIAKQRIQEELKRVGSGFGLLNPIKPKKTKPKGFLTL